MTEPASTTAGKPRFFLAQITLPWVLGVLGAFGLTVIAGAVWKAGVDAEVGALKERMRAQEAATATMPVQAVQTADTNKKLEQVLQELKALNSLQGDMAVMQFRMGNVEYALGIQGGTAGRKK